MKQPKVQKIHVGSFTWNILTGKIVVAQSQIYIKYVNYNIICLLKNFVKYDDKGVKNNKNCV